MFWLRVSALPALFVVMPCLAEAQVIMSAPPPLSPAGSPDSGSALVSADPQSCANNKLLTLTAVRASRTPIAYSRDTGTCRWIISGLASGTYEVDLSGPVGSGGRATFMVSEGTVAEVRIPVPVVRVSGRIRVNGKPVADARVSFQSSQAGLPTVRTDINGAFDANLAEPGQYSIRISGKSIYLQATAATFASGANTFNWEIGGGTLTVRVVGWDRTSNVSVRIDSARSSQTRELSSVDSPILVLHGVPYGTYELSARQGTRRTSRSIVYATLSEQNADSELNLELGDNGARLVVTDDNGEPLSGAMLESGGVFVAKTLYPPPDETAPGVFLLAGMAGDAPLRVRFRSLHIPECVRAQFNQTTYLKARTGRRVEIRSPRADPIPLSAWSIVATDPAHCAVPLSDLIQSSICRW